MGKKLIVKGADFSEVAVETGVKQYLYGIPDSQMSGSNLWTASSLGFSLAEQSVLQGKTIHGIRMNVSSVGSITISKATIVNPNTASLMTEVAHGAVTSTGIKDIEFDVPVELHSGEYLIISAATLIGKFHSRGITGAAQQKFYYNVGKDSIMYNEKGSLDVDFYTYI